jgi:hypothetical protein
LATVRCKRCGMPICNDCKMVSEIGVVCSQACLDAIKAFQDRVKEDVPRPAKRPWLSRGAIRGILAVVVLFGIVYGILCLRARQLLSPDDVLEQLDHWFQFFSTYF